MPEVVRLGPLVQPLLDQGLMILFAEPVPDILADYCVVHNAHQILAHTHYQALTIGATTYPIQRMGEEARQTWNELGHLTIRLASEDSDLPGSLYVDAVALSPPQVGDRLVFQA